MGDGCQHLGAILHKAVKPSLHAIKGGQGLLYFLRSSFNQWWYVLTATKLFGLTG